MEQPKSTVQYASGHQNGLHPPSSAPLSNATMNYLNIWKQNATLSILQSSCFKNLLSFLILDRKKDNIMVLFLQNNLSFFVEIRHSLWLSKVHLSPLITWTYLLNRNGSNIRREAVSLKYCIFLYFQSNLIQRYLYKVLRLNLFIMIYLHNNFYLQL